MGRYTWARTTRADLIAATARAAGCHETRSRFVIDHLLEVLADVLVDTRDGQEAQLELRGFGRFYTKKRKGNPAARNPRTGESIPVPAHRVLLWKPSPKITFRMEAA
jgi:integration host factor subunit beta